MNIIIILLCLLQHYHNIIIIMSIIQPLINLLLFTIIYNWLRYLKVSSTQKHENNKFRNK